MNWFSVIRHKTALFLLALAPLFAHVGIANAGVAEVTNARIWDAPDHTRLVLELSGQVKHSIMTLSGPDRLVLDIKNAKRLANFSKLDLSNSPIKKIRSARRNDSDLRVVLDLREKVSPKSFLLKPNDNYGNRLVVDLYDKSGKKKTVAASPKAPQILGKRDVIVVIDPGHGGEDPGAIGPSRVREKDVVFSIARELQAQINKMDGYKAYLTRTGDYYVGLRKRTSIARKRNADLLISIHADAFVKAQANGASVYAVSLRGATSERARWLAKKENAADLIGGVTLEDKDDVLASVLLDLSSTASLKASLGIGDSILKSMGGVARLHQRKVQQAGFVVLKSPDIPSLLVETGFISNPAESRRLKTKKYQRKIATAIKSGMANYFEKQPPQGTYLASRSGPKVLPDFRPQPKTASSKNYVVRKGDTLSQIALRNDVSLNNLRRYNGLSSDTVRIGQRLKIPSS